MEVRMCPRQRTLPAALLAATVGLVVLAGCSTGQKVSSERAAAANVARLRDEADDCFARFTRSRGSDLEALECFAEKHRQTIEIWSSPSLCPLCYLNYGFGLRLLGKYQYTLREKLQSDLERARASADVTRLESAIAQADAKMKTYFRESNTILGLYLTAPGNLEPSVYLWLAQQHFELGEHEVAVRNMTSFIDLVRGSASPDELAGYERLRRTYQAAWNRAKLDSAVGNGR
ncbi:MAG TPA: hypothetical protein VK116_10445 [Planctomycetota bacterium]|nr:hypothetical protein [Planctomycetota bacterium]